MNNQLEALIDREGLDTVLAAIREICYAKASHIAVYMAGCSPWLRHWLIAKCIECRYSAAQSCNR